MPQGPLVIEPVSFTAASAVLGRLAYRVWGDACIGIDQAGMAGDDPIGREWGAAYDQASGRVIGAVEAVVNGSFRLAGLLEQAGFNWSVAESASTVGVRGERAADTTAWAAISCSLGRPSSAVGSGASAPAGWSFVSDAVGRAWPNGHQDRLLAAAGAWRRSSGVLRSASAATWSAEASLVSTPSPDAAAAETACRAVRRHLDDLATAQEQLADACSGYAHHLDVAHAAIISELEDFVAWSAGIQAVGLLGSLFSFGTAEAPAQAAEAGRIALTAARIASLIEHLREGVLAVQLTIAAASARVAATVEALGPLLRAEPVVAGVVVVRASEISMVMDAATRAEVAAQSALSMAAARRTEAAAVEAALAGSGRTRDLTESLEALAGKHGNWSVPGRFTRAEADEIGRAWVGPGARWSKNRTALISRDGLRQYRPAQWKHRAKRWRANIEARPTRTGKFVSDGHIEIKD